MRERRRPWGAGLVLVVGALVIPVALAWACIPVANLKVSPVQVQPGQEVTVTGGPFGSSSFPKPHSPVVLHLNAVDGPVLATIEPDGSGALSGSFVVPADTKPGNYVVVATQEAQVGDTTWGVPARALLQVVGDGGAPVVGQPLAAPVEERPVGLVEDAPVGVGELLLVGLGVAGVALFAAGMIALASARRRGPTAEAVVVKK
ncbi:MAG: hypothetical protein M3Q48_16360 [Actinomycetota bacterium]|nr:hypothetical protein [Actinomycetota bacterium]